ncbi:uncharacterized protein PG998_005537 [Apiospora kogelbergensis]|uniref:uncharacterized protein n=1 Tax=Apiospora kogelbergensis TaxID=1337665 RepID=UPI00312CEFF4
METTGLQRLFRVELSDGRVLLLKLPPSQLVLRLLRWEHYLTLSEPFVIEWIYREILEKRTQPASCSPPGIPMQESFVGQPNSQTDFLHLQSPNMGGTNQEVSSAMPSGESLLSCLPALIASSTFNDTLGIPFSLWMPATGTSISNLTEPLTPSERRVVEYQKGHLFRQLTQLRAPNSRFGPAVAVLGGGAPSPSDASIAGGLPVSSHTGSNGVKTWSTAFLALVEGILRDGEDTAIMLSYSLIRGHMNRLSYTLDDVTEPRLVLCDVDSDSNVLVTRSTNTAQLVGGSYSRAEYTENNVSPPAHPLLTSIKTTNRISITGLQDCSNCIFGDPLMANVFSRGPSDDFLRGFWGRPPIATGENPGDLPATTTSLPPSPIKTPESTSPSTVTKTASKTWMPSLAAPSTPPCGIKPGGAAVGGFSVDGANHGGNGEKRESCRPFDEKNDGNAAIRALLYECYHATSCVVKQLYQPSSPESTQLEMVARRHLTEVLRKLNRVQREPAMAGSSSNYSSNGSGSSSATDGSRRPKSSRDSEGDGEDGGWPIKRAKSEPGD